MSSVVIAGNTSGSITLSAPATAGTNTITLPAETGTLVTTATSSGISGSAITTGTVGVAYGGTGANTLTANNVILGNGTSAVQFVAPGSSGNVLTSNGTTWTSAAAAGGSIQTQIFTAPGTWTKPASVTQVKVTVVGGGGAGAPGGGNPGTGGPGGTSSFGALVSATGGNGCGPAPGQNGANGTGTVTTGTALVSGKAVTYTTGSTAATNGIQSALAYNINGLSGPGNPGNPSGVSYSVTSGGMAGLGGLGPASGNYNGGSGGLAIAICPVSAPVAITVGSGGTPVAPIGGSQGGVGGAIVVEFVG